MNYKFIPVVWNIYQFPAPEIEEVKTFIQDAHIIVTAYGEAYTRDEVIGVQLGKDGPLLIQFDGHDTWSRILGKYIEKT